MSGRGKIIKPPMEEIARGKVFKPSKHFRTKKWFSGIFSAVILWIVLIGLMTLGSIIESLWNPLNFWYWLIVCSILFPYLITYPIYIRSFEYSVVAKSGSPMPEIYIKKGLINVTRKHVPFRNITNISSVAGPFDRLFGIGSIEIETAGGSGLTTSPVEKLEGLTFYEELRDFIILEVRKFNAPYVTRTEQDDPVIYIDDSREDEVLQVVREIRDLLRRETKVV